MIVFDLFEADDNKPQAAYVPVKQDYPGDKNRVLGNANIALIMKSLDTPGNPPVTIGFLDGTSRTLTPAELNLIADYYDTLASKAKRANFIYRTLLSRSKMFELLNRLKQLDMFYSQQPDEEPPEPEQLDLFKEEKKSSQDSKFKSTRLDRLKTQARARHPAAASDTEAMVADFIDQQDQDQKEIGQVKAVNRRQDDLLKQITALNKSQEQEIEDLESQEINLQQNIQQLQAANAELARKLADMSQRRQPAKQPAAVAPAVPPVTVISQPGTSVSAPQGPGVSVATDKQKKMRYVPARKAMGTKRQTSLDQPSLGTATVGGQSATVLPRRIKDAPIPGGLRGSRIQEVQDIPFGMTENEVKTIPRKVVIQGYTVEYEPVSRAITVSRGGKLVGRAPNKPGSYNNYFVVVNRIIDASEEDKYPDDLEARSVERPFGESTEELTAQDILFRTAAKAMYDANQQGVDLDYEEAIKIASKLMRIPYAPSMLPALQSQLADVEKKIATLKSVRKSQRQREREKVTHQPTADEERRREEFMKNYGQSLQRRLQTRQTESEQKKQGHSKAYQAGGREAYYGRPKNNPYEKGTEEYQDYNRGYRDFEDNGKEYTREQQLDRSGQPMYKQEEVYMLTHDGKEIAFYRLKDLKRAEQDAKDMQRKLGGEVHIRKVIREGDQKPADDDIMKQLFRDFGEIFGKQPVQPKPQEPKDKPVKEGRAGYGPLLNQKHWEEVEQHLFKIINDPNVDDQTRAEAKQRWLDKQREAKLKGFK